MRHTSLFGRRTKIVCTIGQATSSATMIEQLIRASMNIARLNLLHWGSWKHQFAQGGENSVVIQRGFLPDKEPRP